MSAYIRTGRGGAGNMKTAEELKKKEQDLEAAEGTNNRRSIANDIAAQEAQHPHQGEYKHMGRGGAGNWFTPSEDASADNAPPPAPEEEAPQQHGSTRQWVGRGGAGNYVPPEEEKPKEFELKEGVAKRLSDDVRKDVDMVLERPGRAHLGPQQK